MQNLVARDSSRVKHLTCIKRGFDPRTMKKKKKKRQKHAAINSRLALTAWRVSQNLWNGAHNCVIFQPNKLNCSYDDWARILIPDTRDTLPDVRKQRVVNVRMCWQTVVFFFETKVNNLWETIFFHLLFIYLFIKDESKSIDLKFTITRFNFY